MIWTLPFGMEFWMTGAEITLLSRVIAKYSPTFLAV